MIKDRPIDRIRWRWGFVVAVAMALIALFPQIYFCVYRGDQWHGANAISHPDEVAYSTYLASVIRGNPRRFDPFTHRGSENDPNAPESLFSIQFVPPYALGLPAAWLGLRASHVFIILPPVCALATSLVLFWFFWLLTRNDRFSAGAVAIVLGFGAAIAGQGIVRHVLNLPYLIPQSISNAVAPASIYHLPFLRLYQPAVAFPLFFVFCGLVWKTLTGAKRSPGAAAAAGLVLVLLIFSYFFLWTAAAAWLVALCGLVLIFDKAGRKRILVTGGIVLVLAVPALIPYFRMLSHRAATLDAAQALVSTHRPDLIRFPEVLALVVLAFLGFAARKRKSSVSDPLVRGAAAFAVTVFAIFNQQILTGRSLQPIHYQWFIGNYCALIALVLGVGIWLRNDERRRFPNRKLAAIAAIALAWAFAEVWLAASVAFAYNRAIDEGKPVANRLAEISRSGQTDPAATVLVSDLRLADRFPTDAPQAILWSPHLLVFPGVGEVENRERFWRQLYYLGYDEKRFWAELDHPDWYFLTGLFPYNRLSPALSGSQAPITAADLREQLADYLQYAKTFDYDRAASPALSYVITQADKEPDYANLDRWYQRDNGEKIGGFVLYRVKLR